MQVQKAKRSQAKMRLGLQGPSGSGKTFSALKIAYGLCDNWDGIVVIDTEHGSSNLYAHLGHFGTISFEPPYTPEHYMAAIDLAEEFGAEVIIIDSLSHEWEGSGGILDIHANMAGNSFTNWAKLTPRHNSLVNRILSSSAHIIATIRSKQDYVLMDKNGKAVPEKVGLKGIQRDGVEYEFTTLFELDIKHNAIATKDRTGLFSGRPEFRLTESVGKELANWCCCSNEESITDPFIDRINATTSVVELVSLYRANPETQAKYYDDYVRRRKELTPPSKTNQISSLQKLSKNGIDHA